MKKAPEVFSWLTVQNLPRLPLIDSPLGQIWQEKTTFRDAGSHLLFNQRRVAIATLSTFMRSLVYSLHWIIQLLMGRQDRSVCLIMRLPEGDFIEG